jgi:hypothetical protein
VARLGGRATARGRDDSGGPASAAAFLRRSRGAEVGFCQDVGLRWVCLAMCFGPSDDCLKISAMWPKPTNPPKDFPFSPVAPVLFRHETLGRELRIRLQVGAAPPRRRFANPAYDGTRLSVVKLCNNAEYSVIPAGPADSPGNAIISGNTIILQNIAA